MLILNVILVLSTVALVGVAFVVYRHVRRHLRDKKQQATGNKQTAIGNERLGA